MAPAAVRVLVPVRMLTLILRVDMIVIGVRVALRLFWLLQ